MLLEIMAVGDAYGSSFENAPEAFVLANNDGLSYKQRHKDRPLGLYTDDVQMAIAISELMLSDLKWTELNVANALVSSYKRDPRAGYARGFGQLLEDCADGEDLLLAIRPRSNRTGAATRSPPIGLFPEQAEVVDKASRQASVTHDTEEGRNSAIASALMVHWFAHCHGEKEDLRDFLARSAGGPWKATWFGPVKNLGYQAVLAALTAIEKSSTLTEVLFNSIAFSGDTDTVASIALAAASFCGSIKDDLAPGLREGLEDGPFGRGFLEGLDYKLHERFMEKDLA